MAATARGWDGEVVGVCAPRTSNDTNLDQRAWRREELPFRLVVRDPNQDVTDLVKGASLVAIGVDYRHVSIARTCARLGVPYVVTAEYNLRTRLQIAGVEEERLDKRARRMLWEIRQEAKQRRVIAQAAGMQCNGTPSFDAWAKLNRDPLL